MNDFLEKNWPTLIIVALIAIAIAMAGKLTSTNMPGTGLQYKRVDKTPIAAMEDSRQPVLGLTVDGKPVDGPYLTTLILKNTGKIPIRKEDYESPILLEVTNQASIVQMRHQSSPPDMNTEVEYSPKELTIAPALMNPDDVLILHVFTKGGKPEFEFEARIQGVKKVYMEEGWKTPRWSELSGVDYLIFLVSLFNIMLFAIFLKPGAKSKYVFIRRCSGVLLYISMCIVSLYTYFDLIEGHTPPIYRSSILLIGCSIIMFLLAWLVVRFTEKDESET